MDGKSMLDLLTLAAEQGSALRALAAQGRDAAAAVEAIAALFEEKLCNRTHQADNRAGPTGALMEVRRGIAVAPGVAIGPALVLGSEDFRIPQRLVRARRDRHRADAISCQLLDTAVDEITGHEQLAAARLGEQYKCDFRGPSATRAGPQAHQGNRKN